MSSLEDARKAVTEAIGYLADFDYPGSPYDSINLALPQMKAVQDFLGESVETGLGFTALRYVNQSRAARWHPGFPGTNDWTGGDWGNAMAGECGEACNVVKKLRRVEEGFDDHQDETPDELLEALGRELADVVTYADLVAAKYNIDLGHWVAVKFNEVSRKWGFPERLPLPPEACDCQEKGIGLPRWHDGCPVHGDP